MQPTVDWKREVEDERTWRHDHYAGEDTPLSAESRKAYRGLEWWPIDPAWRVPRVPLQRHAKPRVAQLAATGDDAVTLLEVGTFEFDVPSAHVRLLAFEPAPGEADEAYILIPFRDATSGKETYGAGRYLDLEPNADDLYDLDFNRAYHPYCAHDDQWTCTLPPPQNRIEVRVEAGERMRG